MGKSLGKILAVSVNKLHGAQLIKSRHAIIKARQKFERRSRVGMTPKKRILRRGTNTDGSGSNETQFNSKAKRFISCEYVFTKVCQNVRHYTHTLGGGVCGSYTDMFFTCWPLDSLKSRRFFSTLRLSCLPCVFIFCPIPEYLRVCVCVWVSGKTLQLQFQFSTCPLKLAWSVDETTSQTSSWHHLLHHPPIHPSQTFSCSNL